MTKRSRPGHANMDTGNKTGQKCGHVVPRHNFGQVVPEAFTALASEFVTLT